MAGDDVEPTHPKGVDPKTGEPVEVPVAKRSVFHRLLHRAEKWSPQHDSGPYTALDPAFEQKVRTLDKAFREKPPTDY
jgi:hypothetical protein